MTAPDSQVTRNACWDGLRRSFSYLSFIKATPLTKHRKALPPVILGTLNALRPPVDQARSAWVSSACFATGPYHPMGRGAEIRRAPVNLLILFNI